MSMYLQKVISKIFVDVLKVINEIAGSGSAFGSAQAATGLPDLFTLVK
jgi:hypothetical protein